MARQYGTTLHAGEDPQTPWLSRAGDDSLPAPSRTTTNLRRAVAGVGIVGVLALTAVVADRSNAPAAAPSAALHGSTDAPDSESLPWDDDGPDLLPGKHVEASPTPAPTEMESKRSKTPLELRDALLDSLSALSEEKAFLFGHQNDNREGQYFWDENGLNDHSDVFNLTGQWPGLYGYDMQNLADGKKMTNHVLRASSQNAVVSFFWEAKNPVTGGGARDCSGSPCTALMPGGEANGNWTRWMDTIIDNLKEYKMGNEQVPLVVRLFHENTEGWYWWGTDCCAAENYRSMYNYTRNYLSHKSGLDNLLYIYAPAKVADTQEVAFVTRYPGDDLVDIIGFDRYSKVSQFKTNFLRDCRTACAFAQSVGKPCAAGEVGIADGIQTVTAGGGSAPEARDWFETDLLDVVFSDANCSRLTYILTWSNEQPQKYWVPLAGQPSAPGFINFTYDNRTMFAGDLKWESVRKAHGFEYKDSTWTNETSSAAHNADLKHERGYRKKDRFQEDNNPDEALGPSIVPSESQQQSDARPEDVEDAPLRSSVLWD